MLIWLYTTVLAGPTVVPTLRQKVPNPPPAAPQELQDLGNLVLGLLKYGLMVSGGAGLLFCAIQMTIGRRNRNQLAVEGATGIPWVGLGLSAGAIGAPLLDMIFLS